jgi:hypothetical protein
MPIIRLLVLFVWGSIMVCIRLLELCHCDIVAGRRFKRSKNILCRAPTEGHPRSP